jgi:hypothetical protein
MLTQFVLIYKDGLDCCIFVLLSGTQSVCSIYIYVATITLNNIHVLFVSHQVYLSLIILFGYLIFVGDESLSSGKLPFYYK